MRVEVPNVYLLKQWWLVVGGLVDATTISDSTCQEQLIVI